MADGRFDELLLGMAQKHRGIEDLLYTMMSFFERRTEFFHVQEDGSGKGRPAGKAEESFRQQFRAMQKRYLERAQPHLIATPEQIAAASGASGSATVSRSSSSGAAAAAAAAAPSGNASTATAGGADAAGGAAPAPAPSAPIPDGVAASPLDGGDPGQWERMQASGLGYKWNQSTQDVTVEINVEKCTAADIKVNFAPRKLIVKRKGEVILEGALSDKINCEESTWHLDSGKQVVLSLEKIKPTFWESLFDRAKGR